MRKIKKILALCLIVMMCISLAGCFFKHSELPEVEEGEFTPIEVEEKSLQEVIIEEETKLLQGAQGADDVESLETIEIVETTETSETNETEASDKYEGMTDAEIFRERKLEEARAYAKAALKNMKEDADERYDNQIELLQTRDMDGPSKFMATVENVFIYSYILKDSIKRHLFMILVVGIAGSIFIYKAYVRKDKERAKNARRFGLIILMLVIGVIYLGELWSKTFGYSGL